MTTRKDASYQAHIDRLVSRAEIERSIYLGMLIGGALEALGRFASGFFHPARPAPRELRHLPH